MKKINWKNVFGVLFLGYIVIMFIVHAYRSNTAFDDGYSIENALVLKKIQPGGHRGYYIDVRVLLKSGNKDISIKGRHKSISVGDTIKVKCPKKYIEFATVYYD